MYFSMHTQATLKTLKRYSIGRILGRWENLTPPIQGGSYQVQADEAEETMSDDASIISDSDKQDSGIECDTASDISSVDCPDKTLPYRRLKYSKANAIERIDSAVDVSSTLPPSEEARTPAAYIENTVQHEIDVDLAKYPSLDADTQRDIALKFQALHQRVKDEGFYECRFIEYGKEMTRYATLFALFIFTLNKGWYFVSACFLGLFWHQIMFTAHDAGHRGITRNITADTLIGIFIADLCCGLSIGWWKSSHNVHHLVTNAPVRTITRNSPQNRINRLIKIKQEHDPDIQNIPLFATAPAFLQNMRSTYYPGFEFLYDAVAAIAVRIQKYTYYPVMAIARFNLYLLSWGYLLSPRSHTKGKTWWTRPTEIACIAIYFVLYFYVLLYSSIPTWTSRALFLLTSHLITMPLHVQITLSHWGTSTSDLGPGESFAQRQLRTTMDVSCPAWLDFVHGGLQFQVVHHLFPRVPRHNLRALQVLVREFCAETEIEYLIHGFKAGNGVVLNRLQEVAEQARMMAACQKHMAETGESGLH